MRSSLSQPGSAALAFPAEPNPLEEWEALWAPYDEETYANVLAAIDPSDVVLDIGAGDLRLAWRIAERAQRVIAWEIQPELLASCSGETRSSIRLISPQDTRFPQNSSLAAAIRQLPANLVAVVADARTEPVPVGVTLAVLLMRHCTHYALYVEKLRAAGCRRLITNARWGMGVEVIGLGPGRPFDSVAIGWYACRRCGAVGFAGDDARQVVAATFEHVEDVEGCPLCLPIPVA